jgi:3-oxo-4-pregnene-20-carboxyl-CoA dehydrogenase beta subunit
MFLDLTADQRALRDELRAYFAGLASPAERAELLTERHGAVYRAVVRRMGRDGWPPRGPCSASRTCAARWPGRPP